MKSGMSKKSSGDFIKIAQQLRLLAKTEVLVGFPEDTADRQVGGVSNATLGYIHDNGAPEQNIPQRQFMTPGIEAAKDQITRALQRGVEASLAGNTDAAEQAMHTAGLVAKLSIQRFINDGIPPPLAAYTLKARARRGRKGAKEELALRATGAAPTLANAKPLVDTAQMRNAVNYAIRARERRK